MGRGAVERFFEWPEHRNVREHLQAVLTAEGPTCTLVRAPTGNGKTTLSSWLDSSDERARMILGLRYGPEGVLADIKESIDPTPSAAWAELKPSPLIDVLLPQVAELLSTRQIKTLFIDDADTLLHTDSLATQRSVVSMLRTLSAECGLSIVLFTQPDGALLLQAGRWPKTHVLKMGPVGDSLQLREWLSSIESEHGDGSYDGHLFDDEVVSELLYLSCGFIDFIQTFSLGAINKARYSVESRMRPWPSNILERIRQLATAYQPEVRQLAIRVDAEWRSLP